jgi:hypothetical protein
MKEAAEEINSQYAMGGKLGKGKPAKTDATVIPEKEEIENLTLDLVISLAREERANWVSQTEIVQETHKRHSQYRLAVIAEIVDFRLHARENDATIEHLPHGNEKWHRLISPGNIKSIPINWVDVYQKLLDISLDSNPGKIDAQTVAKRCDFKHKTPAIKTIMRELHKRGLLDELNHPVETQVYAFNGNLAAGKIHDLLIGGESSSQGPAPTAIQQVFPSVNLDGYKILLAYTADFQEAAPRYLQINCQKPIHTITATDTQKPMGEGYLVSELERLVEASVLESESGVARSYKLIQTVVALGDDVKNVGIDSQDPELAKGLGVTRNQSPAPKENSLPMPTTPVVPEPVAQPAASPEPVSFESVADALKQVNAGDVVALQKKHQEQLAEAKKLLQECDAEKVNRQRRLAEIANQIRTLEKEEEDLNKSAYETQKKAIDAQRSYDEAMNYATPEYSVLKQLQILSNSVKTS